MTLLSDGYTKLKKLIMRTKKELSINLVYLVKGIMNRDISLTKFCKYCLVYFRQTTEIHWNT